MDTKEVGSTTSTTQIIQNLIISLTVSFVALSLGAALGILSGRGAFAGMLSAGIIAFITSVMGGTRVQCSGPTAPMSAVSAVVVAYAFEKITMSQSGILPDHFINIVFIMTGVILVIMGLLRLGRFIKVVPNVVVSGFMNGISVLIWVGQIEVLFGLAGAKIIGGSVILNTLIALLTLVIIYLLPYLLNKISPHISPYLPSTLIAIVVITLASNLLALPIEHVQIDTALASFGDLTSLLASQWPSAWSMGTTLTALPFALQLAMLCYLDTLLTSLVVDKMSKEQTKQNKELVGQGVANAAVAFVGGVPGAQATIRSVLMLKEHATLRLAGIFVGVFVIIETLIFQNVIVMIPKAVFVGILFKVGYDVFDHLPMRIYFRELMGGKLGFTHASEIIRPHHERIFVTNLEMLFIIGTTVITLIYDLNLAVISFSIIFYVANRFFLRKRPLRDLKVDTETKLYATED